MTQTNPKNTKKPVASALQLYSRLFSYVRPFWIALVIALLGSMLYSGIDAKLISFLQPLLNKGLIAKDHHFLAKAPYVVLGIFILRSFASFFSNYYIGLVSRNVIMQVRQDIFAHLQRLPARFYDHSSTGQILSVLLYSVEQVSNASADVLTTAIQAFFLIVSIIYVMLKISWKLTLMYFAIVPLVTVVMRFTSLRVRRLSLGIQESVADLSHRAEENIEGYKVVRAYEGQKFEVEKFNKATRINRLREMKVVVTRTLSVSAIQFLTAIALALTIYIASLDISDSILTPGGFVVMVTAMMALLKPMKDMALVQNKLYRGLAGAQKVFELMDEKPEEDTGTHPLERASGKIELSNVNFTYEGDLKVLQDISFTIEPGETIAVVGRSGSGKSTLISLLPRFYNDYTGVIKIDGISVRDYRLEDLRRQFAVVSQHVTLFHDTVINNIAYGRLDQVTEADIIAAAKASYAMEFIEKLPAGLNALIGENGVLLSGGQRQRIAIARAILKNAPILILDEATSALDTESERYIQAALEGLMHNRTTLVIAHRLSTIEHADKIIVMDAGQIIEVGTHAELLMQHGHYANLHKMQFRDTPQIMEISNAV